MKVDLIGLKFKFPLNLIHENQYNSVTPYAVYVDIPFFLNV